MSEKNTLASLIPRIYHQSPNQLTPLLEVLERNRQRLEQYVENFTTLQNLDNCPDFYLPYLAALINVPLWGEEPQLWRKQIKNWPYICRLKGTKKAVAYFMDAIGSTRHDIVTYWRDEKGNLTSKLSVVTGTPFLDEQSLLWFNSKTHYFSICVSLDEEDYQWSESFRSVQERVKEWIEFVKPFHAELLRFEWTTRQYDNQEINENQKHKYQIQTKLEEIFQWEKTHYGDGRYYGRKNFYGTGNNEELSYSLLGLDYTDVVEYVICYGDDLIVGEKTIVGSKRDQFVKETIDLKIYKNGVEAQDV